MKIKPRGGRTRFAISIARIDHEHSDVGVIYDDFESVEIGDMFVERLADALDGWDDIEILIHQTGSEDELTFDHPEYQDPDPQATDTDLF